MTEPRTSREKPKYHVIVTAVVSDSNGNYLSSYVESRFGFSIKKAMEKARKCAELIKQRLNRGISRR